MWGNLAVHSTSRAAPSGHRVAHRELHRAGRHRHRQTPRRAADVRGSRMSRRRCGASRPSWRGAPAGGGVRRGRRGGGPAVRREHADAPLRGRREATVVASWGRLGDALAVGTRMPWTGENVTALVRRTGRPVRIDEYSDGERRARRPHARARACGRRWAPDRRRGTAVGRMVGAQSPEEPLPAGPRRASRSSPSWSRRRSRTPRRAPSCRVARADRGRRRRRAAAHRARPARRSAAAPRVARARAPSRGGDRARRARGAEPSAGSGRRGAHRGARRAARALARHPPGDPLRGRPGTRARSARAPLSGSGRARLGSRQAARRARRGGGLLRRLRSTHQFRKVRPGDEGRRWSSKRETTYWRWRSATRASAAPNPRAEPA